ncbi:hypothetical protein BOX15_Mlig033812g1 [Macrostomum lignano]|uniref:Alpha-1,4-N-acetylglucosaminyltransferase n=1 Tax=Macrostomum lignano TaxID=282301 RepID=A0A267GVK0_9PLAT|nr:hypothetical protein BOX15_Mlig033812g1 [Macrostomum lignano]
MKRKILTTLSVLTLIGLVFVSNKFSATSFGNSYRLFENRLINADKAGQDGGRGGGNATRYNVTTLVLISKPAAETKIPRTPAGVPKIIHFVYRDANVLAPYREALQTCVTKNPDWQVVLWTDQAIKAFMQKHFSSHMKVFESFPHKIQRSDAIRYLILYKYGGLYMDLDMTCHAPLLPSLAPHSCFLDSERRHQTQFLHGRQYSAMNSAMGCTPGHPFFRQVIRFVFRPSTAKRNFLFPVSIFSTTGPEMLTKQFDLWKRDAANPTVVMLNETYFSPKINPRSGIYGRCKSMAPRLQRHSGGLSPSQRVCLQLQQMGFEKSDELFITNRTVAIHQFTHLGYHKQRMPTFDAYKEFPRLITYEQLESSQLL